MMQNNVFSSVDGWWLWKAPVPLKRASFSLADSSSSSSSSRVFV